MLETRMSSAGTLPRSSARILWTPPPSRESTARALPAARPAVRPASRRSKRNRLVRSEARLLTVAVSATALMCAVLLVYLAAYAHVTQLGLEQSQAKAELHAAQQENDRLQAQFTILQSPRRVAAAAQKLGMTLGGRPATYISAPDEAARTAAGGRDGQGEQVANSGTTADGSTAAFDH